MSVESLPSVKMADEYYDLATGSHFWIRWRLGVLRNILESVQHRKLRCLDVGCGEGYTARELERFFPFTIDGCDLNPAAVHRATLGRGNVFSYDLLSRERISPAYDLLFLLDVLEHIEDDRGFLEAARAHLSSEGYILLNVPAHQWLFSCYDQAAGHERRYDREQLKELLQMSGFEIIDIRYWGFSLLPIVILRKALLELTSTSEDVYTRGFKPPGKLISDFLSGVGFLERSVLPRPPIGSSIALLARVQQRVSKSPVRNR